MSRDTDDNSPADNLPDLRTVAEIDADADGSLTVDEVDTFVTRETRAAAAHTDREQVPLVIARERSLRLVRVPSAASKK